VGTNNSIFIRDMTTGRTRHLHADVPICTVTWSPDGRFVALGCTDGVIRLLQWETSEEVLQLKGHRDRVLSAAFSPDGRTLASGGVDGTMRLWEMATHKERYRMNHRKSVDSVAFSPNGRLL